MPPTARTVFLWIFLTAAGFLLHAVVAGCSRQAFPDSRDEPALRVQLDGLATKVDQQSALLHRALGMQAPMLIPDETHRQLKRFETRLADAAQWPATGPDAEKLRLELDQFVKDQLPPWTEEELLPRLNLVRWGIRALWMVRNHDAPPHAAAALAEDASSLLLAAPDDAPAELKKLLQAHSQRLQQVAEQHAVASARERARLALAGQAEVAEALQVLEGLEGEGIAGLRDNLRQRLLDQHTDQKLGVIQSTLAAVAKLPTEALRQAGLLKVQDAAAGLLLELHAEQPPRPPAIRQAQALVDQCDQQMKAMAKRQQETYEQKVRAYQKWALEQIRYFDSDSGWHYDVTLPWIRGQLKTFNNAASPIERWELFSEFPSTKALLEEKLNIQLVGFENARLTPAQQQVIFNAASANIGWKENIDQEIAYRTTRDGMVKCLLPINPALLDPAVAQLYHKAFQKGWTKLEGRPDQLHVAEQSAVVKKRGLD